MPNNHINSDWQFRYVPLPVGYAKRLVRVSSTSAHTLKNTI